MELDPLSVDRRYAKICSAATLQSEPKGFFGELINNLEAAVGPAWIANMADQKTDEDKIQFCQQRSEVRPFFYCSLRCLSPQNQSQQRYTTCGKSPLKSFFCRFEML